MIIDVLENADLYRKLNSKFNEGFDFLRNTNLLKLDIGKYEIEGTNIYAIVDNYFTRFKEEGLWEAHRRYIDIQFVVKNKEQMGYANLGQMQKYTKYDQEKDILFFKGTGSYFIIPAGTFVIFTPQDVHMPGIAIEKPEAVKKIVLKILIN
jgi:YhcH/YjgK/YiaL family protein